MLLIFRIHISGPATVQNQNLWSAYMYIYCHAEVSNLPISADRASRNFVENSAISRNRAHLPHFGNITAMIETSRCFFPVYPPPLCYLLCNSNTQNHNPLFTIHIDSWVYLTQQLTPKAKQEIIGRTSTHTGRPAVGLDSTC